MVNVFFLLMIVAQIIAAVSQILLKVSANKEYPSFVRQYLNAFVIGGYGLLMVSMVITILCYDGLGYMAVVVMEPISYILVMIMARFIFKEKVTPFKIAGMVLIIAGIVVFNLG